MKTMMQILGDITKEIEYRIQRVEHLTIEIEGLPHGSIEVKKQKKQEYLYLAHRDKSGKVVHKYVGNISKDKTLVPNIEKAIAKRKSLQKELKKMQEELKICDKMLKIGNKDLQKNGVRGNLKEISENKENPLVVDMPNTQKITAPKSVTKTEDNFNK